MAADPPFLTFSGFERLVLDFKRTRIDAPSELRPLETRVPSLSKLAPGPVWCRLIDSVYAGIWREEGSCRGRYFISTVQDIMEGSGHSMLHPWWSDRSGLQSVWSLSEELLMRFLWTFCLVWLSALDVGLIHGPLSEARTFNLCSASLFTSCTALEHVLHLWNFPIIFHIGYCWAPGGGGGGPEQHNSILVSVQVLHSQPSHHWALKRGPLLHLELWDVKCTTNKWFILYIIYELLLWLWNEIMFITFQFISNRNRIFIFILCKRSGEFYCIMGKVCRYIVTYEKNKE